MSEPKSRKHPVLFIVFNRPDTTKKVFEMIRLYQPEKLYITADGPREHNNEDVINTEAVKDIFHKVDWKCEVYYNYSQQNQGCKMGCFNGISWFFAHEEAGIILEDDCLPSLKFFEYCDFMLPRFKNSDIYCIGGSQIFSELQLSTIQITKYPLIWGWASWRDRWEKFSFNLPDFKEMQITFYTQQEKNYWRNKHKEITYFPDLINTWDYYWLFSIWANGGKCLIPPINLIQNIGFVTGGTHFKPGESKYEVKAKDEINIESIYIPRSKLFPDSILDLMIFNTFFGKGRFLRKTIVKGWVYEIKKWFKR